jgi:hypothetical protein
MPDHVVVRETDPDTHVVTTKILTKDPAEVAQHAGDPSYVVICQNDLSGVAAPYLTVSGGGVLDANGVCTGQLVVKTGPNFVVEQYGITARDGDVFNKAN